MYCHHGTHSIYHDLLTPIPRPAMWKAWNQRRACARQRVRRAQATLKQRALARTLAAVTCPGADVNYLDLMSILSKTCRQVSQAQTRACELCPGSCFARLLSRQGIGEESLVPQRLLLAVSSSTCSSAV